MLAGHSGPLLFLVGIWTWGSGLIGIEMRAMRKLVRGFLLHSAFDFDLYGGTEGTIREYEY
jgi:hypothetical protein